LTSIPFACIMNITNRFKDNVYPARSVVGRLGSGGIDMLRHWLCQGFDSLSIK
jgi:hypothetical protein